MKREDELSEALDGLHDRMREVVELRYGLDGDEAAHARAGRRDASASRASASARSRPARCASSRAKHPDLRDYLPRGRDVRPAKDGIERRRFVRVAEQLVVSCTPRGEDDRSTGGP